MAYQMASFICIPELLCQPERLKKTCFTEKQNEQYLLTSVGKIIFNAAMPAGFPIFK
jgi:DNA-directed RNA polymerase subunit beta'